MEDKIEDILEGALRVFYTEEENVDTNNGMLNEEYLEYNKRRIFKKATEYLIDELVVSKQHYPHKDVSQVDIELDFVVIKAKDFQILKDYVLTNKYTTNE